MILLGSTGSIGVQALEIIKSQNLSVEVLSAGENIELLNTQIAEFRPKIVVIKDRAKQDLVKGAKRVLCGGKGIIEALNIAESSFVLNALVGFSGVRPSLEAIRLGKTLALANKESLVVAGFLIDSAELAKIIPIDSEHFALKELLDSIVCNSHCGNSPLELHSADSADSSLRGESMDSPKQSKQNQIDCHESANADSRNDESMHDFATQNLTMTKFALRIKKMLITASGGAFRDLPLNQIPHQSAESALRHPTWAMGRKITIDSATMINKVFEILEARFLFGAQNIDAVIERSSTIHALIHLQNNALLAHFSANDMRLPIASALLGAKAQNLAFIKELDLMDLNVRFERIDRARYPLWVLKDEVLKNPRLGAIINAANDILVERFLQNQIYFGDISRGIFAVLDKFSAESIKNIDEILELNAKIKDFLSHFKGFKH